jgi:acyl carrier protein
MSEIADHAKKIIIHKLNVKDESKVTPQASFTVDLDADELEVVELFMEFEKEFEISIPEEHIQTIATVGDAITYLENNAK